MNERPESAIEQVRDAIKEFNYDKLANCVNLNELINKGYDEATEELARRCEEFHALYPADLFFQFGAQVVRNYNEKYRVVHLMFVNLVLIAYFDKNLKQPETFEDNPINYAAAELRKFLSAIHSDIKEVQADENFATVTVELNGDDSYYGRFVKQLKIKAEMSRENDEHWKINKIANVKELVSPILEIAETFWPHSWDLGIKL